MPTEADPGSQIRLLTQALGHRDTSLGFLLGAGCGCSVKDSKGVALIPAIAELSFQVCAALRSTTLAEQLKALEMQYAEDGDDGLPNVELMLSRIRSLREISGKGSVRGLSANNLDQLDAAICREIERLVSPNLPLGDTSYSLFARWIREIDRHRPVEIFTTNYDLLLEQALEREHAPFFDGFVGAHEPFFDVEVMELDKLPERWTRVWKIHGSINWRLTEHNSIVRSSGDGAKPLIFPSHLKYAESRRLPYLAMRDRLRTFVRNRAVFITAGYSFADQHINEDLQFALSANAGSVCYALLFGPLENYPAVISLASQRPNLNVIARDAGMLRGRAVTWVDGADVSIGDFRGFANFLARDVMGSS